jgi:DNA-binding response OmpR family regulator
MNTVESKKKLIQKRQQAESGSNYILIVDDEQDILDLFEDCLQMHGWKVRSFLDPREALSEIEKNRHLYSLIITDIRMPRMSGFEFVREARKIAREIKVIFMTAFEIENGQIKEIETTELLKKPIGLPDLVTMVNKVLEK